MPGAGLLCDVVTGGVGESITTSIGNWIAKSIGDLAKSAVDMASRAVDQTTAVDLNAAWFRTNYSLILPIALTMLVMTFILQLVRAAWRRDGQALGQAVTGTVSSVFFAMTAITFTGVAVAVVEALSRGLFTIANSSMDDAVRRLVKVSMITITTPLGWAVPTLVALACAVGAFLYWGMMVFRKVSILILVVLAPLAASGGAWEPTREWRRRWVEATATVVMSKLVMTIIMLVGVSAIGQSDTKDGLTALSDIIAGLVVLALVLCCPFMIYKFVHWAGDGQAHDLHRSTAAGLQTATAAAKKGGQMAMSAGAGGATEAVGTGGAIGTGGAGPQGPAQVPGMQSGGQSGAADPSGGSISGTLSKAAPVSFIYGARSRSGPGDGGVPLISRSGSERTDGDQGQPLITRTGTGTGTGPGTGAAGSGGSAGSPASQKAGSSVRISTPGSAAPSAAAPFSGAAPSGASTPIPASGSAAPSAAAPASGAAPSGASTPAFDPVIAPPAGPAPAPDGQRFTFPQRTPSP
ncbi:conjugal transfer protein TrbL family protein [Kitasatospora purpeofusca]|uniref:SCO6881 family protein n=1 Tax=Kitasatospora purpeofusca TaxID=67352 RepID=UPI0035E2EFC7